MGLAFILFLSLLIMLSGSLITMTLHCSVSEILHGLWTKRRQFDTTNHNCGDSASFFVAASLLGPRIFSFLSDWELLHGLSSIISWVGLVSFSLTLHTSWLFLATFDSVHVHPARINQCLRPGRHTAGRQVELMTASREYIFLRNCQPATLSQGFQKQNEKHSKQNMHFGCISRIQRTQRIVSPVQSLQIFSSELLGVRRALQGSELEVGCGHNQWHSTSVSVTCKPPKHTNTSFQFLVTHKYTHF